jgi:HemY protein
LSDFWKRLSAQERRDPHIAAIAARLFIGLGGCKEAHRLIVEALNQNWSAELILLYGECRDDDALARIQQAETWLKSHPHDATLLLTLGRLCLYRELWGKARSYLEASLTQNPTRTVHRELARLCEQLGQVQEANRHYKQAADEGLAA